MLCQLSYSRSEPSASTAAGARADLNLFVVGGGGFEPPKAYADRFTVCSL